MTTKRSPTLTVTGDLMFYGPLAEQMRARADTAWGFQGVADAIHQGDVLFGNLETPISVARHSEPDAPDCYFSPPGIGRALKELGYDVVNLAHNHIYDFGVEGVETTLEELKSVDLPFIGIGRSAEEAAQPAIVTTGCGVSFGFLGYTTAYTALNPKHRYVACFPDQARVRADVAALKRRVDVVVVSCHTGSQYNPYPAPETRALARTAMEAGALIFLGHHPHVPQGWERVGDGLSLYSLGDFVAPVHNEQTRRTFFARITVAPGTVLGHQIIPCFITDTCQTILAEGALREEIRQHIDDISQAIAESHSDRLHFETARTRFFSQYVTSWIAELRLGGPKGFLRKLCNFRLYHLQLVWHMVIGTIVSVARGRRRR